MGRWVGLRFKLFSSSFVILFLVLAFSALGLFMLNRFSERTDDLYQVYQSGLMDVQTMGLNMYKANRRATDYVLSSVDHRMSVNYSSMKTDLTASIDEVARAYEQFKKDVPINHRTAGTVEVLDQIDGQLGSWSQAMHGFLDSLSDQKTFQDQFFDAQFTTSFDNLTGAFDSLSLEILGSSQTAYEDLRAQNTLALVVFVSFAGAVMVLVLLVIAIQTRVIVRPILRVHRLLAEIAQGHADLTRTLPVQSRDEIGEICSNFNQFLEQLRTLVASVQGNMDSTGAVATSLHQDSVEVSAALTEIHANNQGIRDHIQGLDARLAEAGNSTSALFRALSGLGDRVADEKALVGNSTATINGMIEGIHQVTTISQEKREVSRRLAENSQESGQQLEEASQSVERINNAVGTILEMTQAVAAIAAQTNLLSMNAAIEAAHAGAAGAGFSVVADEIRKLASHSTEQSHDIDRELKAIVAEIQNAWDRTRQARSAFTTLLGEVEDVTRALELIMERNVGLQSLGNQVREALEGLARASEAVSGDMQVIDQSTQGVETAMDLVRRVSSEVATGMGEIAEGTREISLATQKGAESNRILAERVRAVRDDMAQFTV